MDGRRKASHDGGGSQSTVNAVRPKIFLQKTENRAIRIVIGRIHLRLAVWSGGEDGGLFEASDPQPERELTAAADFFIGIGRNPLKSPVSGK